MDRSYARVYENLHLEHWWWRARNQFLRRVLKRRLAGSAKGAVLDIGCGNGLLFDWLREFGEVWGVESDASLVDRHGAHSSRIHLGPFDETFRPPRRFSLITALDVLEHMEDAEASLRHAVSLAESDALFVITVPAFNALWTSHDDINHHETRYTKASLAILADRAGLKIIQARYFFHWTVLGKIAVRAKEALGRGSSKNDVKVPVAPLNRLLLLLSRVEQTILTPLGVPVGTSLLVVAALKSRTVGSGS